MHDAVLGLCCLRAAAINMLLQSWHGDLHRQRYTYNMDKKMGERRGAVEDIGK